MVTKDKHAPAKKDWSTNKTVKSPAKGTSVGTAVKKAVGSKSIKPGVAPAKPATKTVAAPETKHDKFVARVKSASAQNNAKAAKHLGVLEQQKKTGVISGIGALHRYKQFPKSNKV